MDDDPNDLAAAFFASQSAREEARATLPIDDWTRAIADVVEARVEAVLLERGEPGARLAALGEERGAFDARRDEIGPRREHAVVAGVDFGDAVDGGQAARHATLDCDVRSADAVQRAATSGPIMWG